MYRGILVNLSAIVILCMLAWLVWRLLQVEHSIRFSDGIHNLYLPDGKAETWGSKTLIADEPYLPKLNEPYSDEHRDYVLVKAECKPSGVQGTWVVHCHYEKRDDDGTSLVSRYDVD